MPGITRLKLAPCFTGSIEPEKTAVLAANYVEFCCREQRAEPWKNAHSFRVTAIGRSWLALEQVGAATFSASLVVHVISSQHT